MPSAWTKILKPTGSPYTKVNPSGKEAWDDQLVAWDSPMVAWDGGAATTGTVGWTKIPKPSSSGWNKIAKPIS